MPRVIACDDPQQHSLDDCLAMLAEQPFDPADEGSLAHAAVALRRLANQRSFLGDLLLGQLRERHRREEVGDGGYGPQSIVLSGLRGNAFLRTNIWPSAEESCFHASGARSFVYGIPHDHNFAFLTAGYFGPGYRSDYYEYDYRRVAGHRGERAGLRFVERSALHEGKLMLYRAHRDVHAQLPPASLSVSLNIMHVDPAQAWFDQYGFDTAADEITGLLNPTATEAFLRCAVALGGEAAQDLAADFGRHHPSDRLRLASYEARAALLGAGDARDALWREAERSGSRMIAAEARQRRARIASG